MRILTDSSGMKMISKQQAIEIAHTYIPGEILSESCNSYPNCYHMHIKYRDQDGNIFVEAINVDMYNGNVIEWSRQLVDEERVMD